VTSPDVERVKQALEAAGLEIYRALDMEIQVAERVRLHIMDSGVRVRITPTATIQFTARSQRSDFPNADPDALFAKVRGSVGSFAEPRGYVEARASTVEVKDPVDDNRILDVWHEVTYEKPAPDLQDLVDEVRWALAVEKYVTG